MALIEIKWDKFHDSGFLCCLGKKIRIAIDSDHQVEINPKFKGTGGNSGQLSAHSSVHDLPSNSIRQESCCE